MFLKGSIPRGPTLFHLIASSELMSKSMIEVLYAKELIKASPPTFVSALFEMQMLIISFVFESTLAISFAPSFPT